jgi:hypothetical protein
MQRCRSKQNHGEEDGGLLLSGDYKKYVTSDDPKEQ